MEALLKTKIGKADSKMKEKTEAKQGGYVKRFFIRIFYTFFMATACYFIILSGTLMTPSILAYVLGGLGFGGTEGQSGAVLIVSMMAGFFLTAWMFVISFMAVRFVWRTYVYKMRETFTDAMNERLDNLFKRK